MERAYYVKTIGSQFIVMCAAPGKTPAVVAGPFLTAIAAWKAAQRLAIEGGASATYYVTAPAYVPRSDLMNPGAWVVTQPTRYPRGTRFTLANPAPGEALARRLGPPPRARGHDRQAKGVSS